jgi:hypothetical protein
MARLYARRFQQMPMHGRNFDLASLGFPQSFTPAHQLDRSEFPSFEINGISILTGGR